MGFRDKLKQKATGMGMSQVTPSETPIGQEVANILTTTEYELFVAVDRLCKAADAGVLQVDETMEERREEVLEIADAVADNRFESWWWENYGADRVDNVEEAREKVALSKSEWRGQIETWAEMWRERAPEVADGKTDAQLADLHTQRRFDVDLATFASEVVEWEGGEHMQAIVRKNLRKSTSAVHHVAAHLEEERGDLENDVDKAET